jgi:hypothetical protein
MRNRKCLRSKVVVAENVDIYILYTLILYLNNSWIQKVTDLILERDKLDIDNFVHIRFIQFSDRKDAVNQNQVRFV